MNRHVTRENKYQENGRRGPGIKGIHIARLLVGSLLVLNIILLYAIFFSSHGLPGYRNQREQVKDLEEKILKLKQDNQELYEKIQAFKNDPASQEKLVRRELGWVRENEIILEFPEKRTEPAENPQTPGKAK